MALWQRIAFLRSATLGTRERLLLLAAAVGALAAVTAEGFRQVIAATHWLLTGHAAGLVATAMALPWWQRLLIPTAGGAVAGAILLLGRNLLRGGSTTDYMEAVVLGDGLMSHRATLVKSASSLASVASGEAIGREGSMVQLCAWTASLLARLATQPVPRRRMLVACGAAAGLAAVYNAPLAGAVFVGEIVLRSITIEALAPLLIATMTASLVTREVFHAAPLFAIPSGAPERAWEFLPVAVMGLMAGLAAPAFLAALEAARRGFTRLTPYLWLRLGLGGLAVGLLAVAEPRAWGNGASTVAWLLHDGAPLGALALLVLLGVRLAGTVATAGSGAVGGIFTPTLVLGATLGALVAQAWNACAPAAWGLAPGLLAVVGMGALLAAATQAPFMAILMVFEMTLDYRLVLPLMLAAVIALAVARRFGMPGIYDLAGKGGQFAADQRARRLMTVAELLQPDPSALPPDADLGSITRAFLDGRRNYLPVVAADGRWLGAIGLHDIKAHLAGPTPPGVVAADLASPIPTLRPEDALPLALERLREHDGNRLPVIDAEGRLLGCVLRVDLLLALAGRDRDDLTA